TKVGKGPLVSVIMNVVLGVAVIALLVCYIGANRFQSSGKGEIIEQIQLELTRASDSSVKLSRSGSTTTSLNLAEVYSHIYSIQKMNDLYVTLTALNEFIPYREFQAIYTTIEAFDSALQKGNTTIAYQTQLTDELASLTSTINNLLAAN
ncbi:MAG: hypothetical protein PHU22_06760, partial [Eubacteriales bacterium]|nr:hypothetical protein [Eubacteriales bacterium]